MALHSLFPSQTVSYPTLFPTIRCKPSSPPISLRFGLGPVYAKSFAPATIANLGPGFDFLGCTVDGFDDSFYLRNDPGDDPGELSISPIDDIFSSSKKPTQKPLRNFAGTAAISVMKMFLGVCLFSSLHKGLLLGSSAVGVDEIFGGKLTFSDFDLAGYRTDNVVPAIMIEFGLIRKYDPLDIIKLKFPIEKESFFALVKHDFEALTKNMRAVLFPSEISMSDLIWNCSQAGELVVEMLQGDLRGWDEALSWMKRAAIESGVFAMKDEVERGLGDEKHFFTIHPGAFPIITVQGEKLIGYPDFIESSSHQDENAVFGAVLVPPKPKPKPKPKPLKRKKRKARRGWACPIL